MSFYIKLIGNELFYGGMKSIQLNYDAYTPITPFTVCEPDLSKRQAKFVAIVGSAVTSSYVKGRFSRCGLWLAEELQELSQQTDTSIYMMYGDYVHIYHRGSRIVHKVHDEYYENFLGCTRGQVVDAIERGILPTRWETHCTVIDI